MTPDKLREIAAEIMRHKSTVAVEGVVPQWLHDQLLAHAAALEELKQARTTSEYWKAEHNSANVMIANCVLLIKELKRDLAASVVKCAEFAAENSKLRSALEIVHFKREPWQ